MNMVESNDKGVAQLHNIRYYNLIPRGISTIACNNELQKLALSREDASIEIWDIAEIPFLQKSIPGDPDTSIEALCWSGSRLFSGGLVGDITEWDLKLLTRKQSVLVTGSSVWCLDVNKAATSIVAGSNEGYLNLFSIFDQELQYEKLMDKQEGKILCCKFHSSGNYIVTGSIDVIRVWSVKTGHVVHKMSTGRDSLKKETIVWAVHFFNDMTIVSGDSRGRLIFWDGNTGAQIESNLALKADILAIGVNETEDHLFCAGVDPTVRTFSYTTIKKENQVTHKWVKTIPRTYHHGDVKALVCHKNKLISGSVDGYLGMVYQHKASPITKYGPFFRNPVSISAEHRLTLFKYLNYLELWRLGEADENESQNVELPLTRCPEKLLQLRSRNDEQILSSAISSNGRWLAYTTNTAIRLFSLEFSNEEKLQISQVKNLPEEFSPCNQLLFTSDSKRVLLYKTTGDVSVFEFENDDVDLKQTIELGKFVKDVVHLLVMDESGKYLACSDSECNIGIWMSNKKGLFKHYINLPKYKHPPTALSFRPSTSSIVATFPDLKCFEYDLDDLKFIFSSHLQLPKTIKPWIVIDHVVFDPRNNDVIILGADKFLGVVDKRDLGTVVEEKKKLSRNANGDVENSTQISCHVNVVSTFPHLIHLSWMKPDNDMIAVAVNPYSIIEQLPPMLKKKRYGKS